VTGVIQGVFIGRWKFVNGNVRVDLTDKVGIEELTSTAIMDNKTYDLIGGSSPTLSQEWCILETTKNTSEQNNEKGNTSTKAGREVR
jgi:hypothetical protein